MGNHLVDQAIRFLEERGFPMVPSRGPQKKPCVPWKVFQNQLPTISQIREWERKYKPNRWGFVTGLMSGRVVIDFDGECGVDLMRKWRLNPHLRTGSGGYHCHISHPGWHVPTLNAQISKNSWRWTGVDIRGDGGFAVLLGRNSNGPYEHLRELKPDPFEALPEEVRKFLWDHSMKEQGISARTPLRQKRTTDRGGRVDSELLIRRALDAASRHGRNKAGFWLACQLRDNGHDQREAEYALRRYSSGVSSTNTRGVREPYTEREMLASLKQAYSRSPRPSWEKRGSDLPAAQYTTSVSRPEHRRVPHSPVPQTPGCPYSFANQADSMNLYVGQTSVPLVGHRSDPLSRAHYSRVPVDVLFDPQLKNRDKVIYAALAIHCWQGSVASIGKRRIAKLTCCAERLVIESLNRLEAYGHILRASVQRGQRAQYVLKSPVFGQKQRAGVQEIITTHDGRRRLASVGRGENRAWQNSTGLRRFK